MCILIKTNTPNSFHGGNERILFSSSSLFLICICVWCTVCIVESLIFVKGSAPRQRHLIDQTLHKWHDILMAVWKNWIKWRCGKWNENHHHDRDISTPWPWHISTTFIRINVRFTKFYTRHIIVSTAYIHETLWLMRECLLNAWNGQLNYMICY